VRWTDEDDRGDHRARGHRARWAVIGGEGGGGGLNTASEVLDGQGRGVPDDGASGGDGALESVKAASREFMAALAGACTTDKRRSGNWSGSMPTTVPYWSSYRPSCSRSGRGI